MKCALRADQFSASSFHFNVITPFTIMSRTYEESVQFKYMIISLVLCLNRLYPEEEYDNLSANTPPEMIRTDLSSAVLQLKALGINNVLRFSFPTPPPAENLLLAFELLNAIGAIDDGGLLISPLGYNMAEFPLPPLHSKTLLNAGKLN